MIRFRTPEGAMTNLALVSGRAGTALPPALRAYDILQHAPLTQIDGLGGEALEL